MLLFELAHEGRALPEMKRAAVADYPDLNSVLQKLLAGARGLLGHRFIGMYIEGSLAMGDFDVEKSDVDFVVVTDADLSPENFMALKALHARIAMEPSKWARELEGSYISQQALRQDRRPDAHPYIDRGSTLAMVHQETGYWVIHRHVLREHGIVLAGPPPKTLIDPVQPLELREAVRGVLREWWRLMLRDGPLLQNGFYRCYAVLTMSRMLYTLRHGEIVSKPVAARWALGTLERRWTSLIRDALAWSRDQPPDLAETLAYIRHTCECSDRL
jgi:Aminoglycoside adenylyltransferase, C-terminal domain